jgi:hypothetical protein
MLAPLLFRAIVDCMSDIESGVLNPVDVSNTTIDGFFGTFNRVFDYQNPADYRLADYDRGYGKRLEDVHALAYGSKMPNSFLHYRSRVSLATHWADSEADAMDRARAIYALAATFSQYAGQTVIRFMDCEYDDAADVSRPLRLEIARTKIVEADAPNEEDSHAKDEPAIAHVLEILKPEARPAEYAHLPLARFGVGLPVELRRQVVARRAGSHKLATKVPIVPPQAIKTMVDFVPARRGIVSLDPDRDLYRKTKVEKLETLLFGDQEANAFISELASRNPSVFERFMRAAGNDGKLFDADKDFPDLSFLTARKSDAPYTTEITTDDIDAILADNAAFMQKP